MKKTLYLYCLLCPFQLITSSNPHSLLTLGTFAPGSYVLRKPLYGFLPAGEILWYVLLRDGVEIFRHPSQLHYTDNNAIQPYQTYRYKLRACNAAGCVDGQEVSSTSCAPNYLVLTQLHCQKFD